MIERSIYKRLEQSFHDEKKALLVTGARQTGKTFAIRKIGNECFHHFIEVNFIEQPEAISIFKDAANSGDILLRLSAIAGDKMVEGDTLVFFDEVQECPEIVTTIKFLVEDGRFRYVMSGSLLGVELKDIRSVPVGYMNVMEMFPLGFEEFVLALGVGKTIISSLREAWNEHKPVDNFVHRKMLELFRLYLVIGGMPEVVNKYIATNNLRRVKDAQQEILHLYKKDIAKYDPKHKLYIEEIFNLIPPELNAKNKRFILKNLNENRKFAYYANSFLWLADAGVALPVYNVEEPKTPLLLARSRNLFKLFQSDVGLLASQYADGLQLKIINGDNDINFGAVYENAVAQELKAHGFDLYYYNNKKRGELDFVIEHEGKSLPIEVKSGKSYERHNALSNIMDCADYDLPEAIVLCNNNLSVKGRVVYAPIYMVAFLTKRADNNIVFKVNIDGLKDNL